MSDDPFDTLRQTFERFNATLDATTVPVEHGRRVHDVPGAVALSEATGAVYNAIQATYSRLCHDHGRPVPSVPGVTIQVSDAPEGPWTPAPPEHLRVTVFPIGGDGADAAVLAALQRAAEVAGFPPERWNALQAQRPGGPHQRWIAGDVVTTADLDVLDSACKLLRLRAQVTEREERRGPAAVMEPKPEAKLLPPTTEVGWVTGIRGVRAYYGLTKDEAERVRSALYRWRDHHADDWRRDQNPKASRGVYLYRVDAVRSVVENVRRREAQRIRDGRKRPSRVRLPSSLA